MFDRARIFWVVLGLLLTVPSAFMSVPHPWWLTALIPTLNAFGFRLILYQVARLPFPKGSGRRFIAPFDYLGKHFYSIYLWHLPLKYAVVSRLMYWNQPQLILLVYLVLGIGIGTLLSEVIEMPMLHLRNRLFPSTLSSSRQKLAPVAVPA